MVQKPGSTIEIKLPEVNLGLGDTFKQMDKSLDHAFNQLDKSLSDAFRKKPEPEWKPGDPIWSFADPGNQ